MKKGTGISFAVVVLPLLNLLSHLIGVKCRNTGINIYISKYGNTGIK